MSLLSLTAYSFGISSFLICLMASVKSLLIKILDPFKGLLRCRMANLYLWIKIFNYWPWSISSPGSPCLAGPLYLLSPRLWQLQILCQHLFTFSISVLCWFHNPVIHHVVLHGVAFQIFYLVSDSQQTFIDLNISLQRHNVFCCVWCSIFNLLKAKLHKAKKKKVFNYNQLYKT